MEPPALLEQEQDQDSGLAIPSEEVTAAALVGGTHSSKTDFLGEVAASTVRATLQLEILEVLGAPVASAVTTTTTTITEVLARARDSPALVQMGVLATTAITTAITTTMEALALGLGAATIKILVSAQGLGTQTTAVATVSEAVSAVTRAAEGSEEARTADLVALPIVASEVAASGAVASEVVVDLAVGPPEVPVLVAETTTTTTATGLEALASRPQVSVGVPAARGLGTRDRAVSTLGDLVEVVTGDLAIKVSEVDLEALILIIAAASALDPTLAFREAVVASVQTAIHRQVSEAEAIPVLVLTAPAAMALEVQGVAVLGPVPVVVSGVRALVLVLPTVSARVITTHRVSAMVVSAPGLGVIVARAA